MGKGWLLVGALLFGSAWSQGALVGDWQGAIGPDSLNLDVTVHFEQVGDALTGTIDIPAQNSLGLELDVTGATDAGVRFVIQGVPGEPTFDGTLAGDSLEGTFSQSGGNLPFTLTRSDQALSNADTGGTAGSEAPSPRAALERFFTEKPIRADWFADSFLAQVPVSALTTGLAGIVSQLGDYQSVAGDSSPFAVNFSQGTATVTIALDEDGKISTLFIGNPVPSGSADEVPVVEALLGLWTGRIDPDGVNQLAGLEFTDQGGILTGTITFPEQSLTLPVTVQTASDTDVRFVIQGAPGSQTFSGTLAGDTLTGTFSVGGTSYETTFERTSEAASLKRPQDPQPPFPYREEEVTYSSGDVPLAGTLTLPEGDGPFPAMLMITGSGPQDRDEALFGHRPFLVIADAVTRAGVAVLRVDDRGVGGSGGDLAQATYDDLVGDVQAGMAFLKARPDIDAARVGLFGHSEGGYLAPLAAARGADPAFVVMMAGPSVSGEKVLELQNRLILELADATPAEVDVQIIYLNNLQDALKREAYDEAKSLVEARVTEQLAAQPESERPSTDVQAQIVAAQQANTVSPYLRSFFLYDPQPALRQLDKPVLAFYGNLDVQVPPVQSVGPLRFALRSAGNDDVTVEVFDGLNHLMQPAIRGGIEEYSQIETTVAPEVLALVTDWLRARVE